MARETIIIDGVRYYVTTLTVREAAEAVSSGRTGKSDAPSKKKTATTWRSPRSRHPLVQAAVTVLVSVSV